MLLGMENVDPISTIPLLESISLDDMSLLARSDPTHSEISEIGSSDAIVALYYSLRWRVSIPDLADP
jgi:hypothetical protein